MKRGLSSRNPKTRLLNIHEAIEKSETKLGRVYTPREVKEPKIKGEK